MSGLANVNVMSAAYAAGIRYVVTDSSQAGYNNPKFNEGIPSTLQAGRLTTARGKGRIADVSTPQG